MLFNSSSRRRTTCRGSGGIRYSYTSKLVTNWVNGSLAAIGWTHSYLRWLRVRLSGHSRGRVFFVVNVGPLNDCFNHNRRRTQHKYKSLKQIVWYLQQISYKKTDNTFKGIEMNFIFLLKIVLFVKPFYVLFVEQNDS